ncbi:MAG: RHS repeat domain-containing protein [Mongoliitalea sp.]
MVQETHYDPWGVELQGLGYQEPGIKVNKYLYNGKELLDGLNLNLYDYGQRIYDPTIGRFNRIDRFSEKYFNLSPYHYGANNPIKYVDVNGDSLLSFMKNFQISGGVTYETLALKSNILGLRTGIDISGDERYLIGYQGDGLEVFGMNKKGNDVRRPTLGASVLGLGFSKEGMFVNGEKISETNSGLFLDSYHLNSNSENQKSIGFSTKIGIYLGIKLNIEYKLENRSTNYIPPLNYDLPGILDRVKNDEKVRINMSEINDEDKTKIINYLKNNFNGN